MPYKLFKGKPNEYTALHQWVMRNLGRPKECENCGTTESKRYEWANISGEYLKDLSDWARLCKRCHALIDNTSPFVSKPFCKRDHPMEGSNLGWKHMHGRLVKTRFCMACNALHDRELRKRKKLLLAAPPSDSTETGDTPQKGGKG